MEGTITKKTAMAFTLMIGHLLLNQTVGGGGGGTNA